MPYPTDKNKFRQLIKLGGQLRTLHLLESPTLDTLITGYPETAWNFHIGGYQPAQKWLKDRKDRELTPDDVFHYQKIIVALTETKRLMGEIDKQEDI